MSKLTVSVEDEEFTLEHATDWIVDRAATQLLESFPRDESIANLRGRVKQITDDEIRARVTPHVEAALAAPIQRTDSYGEPTGQPITIRQQIEQALGALLKPGTDSFSRNGKKSALEAFIADEVTKAFTRELKTTLDAAKTEVIAAVRAAGAELLSDTIKRAAERV